MSKIAIIGSGFSGLSAAAVLSKQGHIVTVYEKNDELGGRARQFKANGYTFDMGPSWYWMPDVFEKFFNRFNKKPSDYYKLHQLDPGFQIIFEKIDEGVPLKRTRVERYLLFTTLLKFSLVIKEVSELIGRLIVQPFKLACLILFDAPTCVIVNQSVVVF